MSAYEYGTTGKLMKKWDDTTRTYTEYNDAGAVTRNRPYTAEENARADAEATAQTQSQNKSTIETNLQQDYVNMQAIKAQTNADLRADPSQEIKQISDAVRRLSRLALENYSGID